MALTGTFVRQCKHTGKASADKHTNGGMYLLVRAGCRYWFVDHTFSEKRKTLALRVCPTDALANARQRRDKGLGNCWLTGYRPGHRQARRKAGQHNCSGQHL
jgi:hypothetical protein